MEANDTRGVANLDPRGIIGRIYVGDNRYCYILNPVELWLLKLMSRTPWIAGTHSLVPTISLYILCKNASQTRTTMARTIKLKTLTAGRFFNVKMLGWLVPIFPLHESVRRLILVHNYFHKRSLTMIILRLG